VTNSVRLAVLTVQLTALDVQAVKPHGGASDAVDLLNVMDHLPHRKCIARNLQQLFCRTGADDIL